MVNGYKQCGTQTLADINVAWRNRDSKPDLAVVEGKYVPSKDKRDSNLERLKADLNEFLTEEENEPEHQDDEMVPVDVMVKERKEDEGVLGDNMPDEIDKFKGVGSDNNVSPRATSAQRFEQHAEETGM